MICPLCLDKCEGLAQEQGVAFPFCSTCVTTLRALVLFEKRRREQPHGSLAERLAAIAGAPSTAAAQARLAFDRHVLNCPTCSIVANYPEDLASHCAEGRRLHAEQWPDPQNRQLPKQSGGGARPENVGRIDPPKR